MAGRKDPELARLLDQYVCVRKVQMGGVDLSLFQFDPFLSWSVFMLHPDRTIYGRFGTASPQTKRNKKDSNPNHTTTTALKLALAEGLKLHAAYTKDPRTLGPKLKGKTGPEPLWKYTESNPAAKKFGRLKALKDGMSTKGCVHCHEVQRTAIDSYFMTRRKLPDRMLWMYPDPARLGLTLSKDHRARVTAVAAASPAARAGVKVGDDLRSLNDQPLVSMADVVWVLHTMPDKGGKVATTLERAGKTLKRTMTLKKGWRREGDFGWRYRVAGYSMWMWGGVQLADHPKGIRVANRSPNWFKKPNRQARRALQRGDLIVAVDGRKGMSRSEYIAYMMRNKPLGSTMVLTVIRGGKQITVKFKMPTVRPEVQGY